MAKTAVTREIKMETIRRSVLNCNRQRYPAIKEKIIAECGKWWGTSRQGAQTMMKEMQANEEIYVDGEDVWTYEQWEKIRDARENDYMHGKEMINKTFADLWQK